MGQISKSGKAGMARLSLTTLAALTPPEHVVSLHDARRDDPDFDGDWDLVGLTAMTAEVPHAYQMADEFRRRGKKVVIGGYHATALPEEAAEHADAVVVGEGERAWPQLLHDISGGGPIRKVYRNEHLIEMKDMAVPCRHLLDRRSYATFATIQTTRGCPYDCDFCSVTSFFGRRFRHRPVDEVVAELRTLRDEHWMFLDDNLTGDPAYAKELLRAIDPVRIDWGAQASTTMMYDSELMDLYAEAGGKYVFIGFESTSQAALEAIHKGWNRADRFEEGISQLHKRGITVMGSFIFGLDSDDLRVFKRTVDFVNRSKIDVALYTILTPFPGTRLFERMSAQGRIHDFDWNHYDACHSVIHPASMTSEELQNGWCWANRETYKWINVLQRVLRPDPGLAYRLALAYSYARKAYEHCPPPADPGKYAAPKACASLDASCLPEKKAVGTRPERVPLSLTPEGTRATFPSRCKRERSVSS